MRLTVLFLLLLSVAIPSPAQEDEFSLTAQQASRLAQLPLKALKQEFPNKLEHVMNGPGEILSPLQLHPVFYGSYDWHSSVHGHWMLVRLLKIHPNLKEAAEIRELLDGHFRPEKVERETAYFSQENRQSFERPYGWAWLLKLAEELHSWDDPQGRKWSANLTPLAEVVSRRYLEYFPKQTYPIRSGVHSDTAFGLTFALDYARAVGNKDLESLLLERSLFYYAKDRDYPASWEPGGDHFLSPALSVADLMRRVLPADEFADWLDAFLPELAQNKPPSLLTPAVVSDRSDPKIVHLDGLNLFRAWAMRGIVSSLPADHPARPVLVESAREHARSALANVTSGDYAGEHWLASFAVFMLSTP